MIKKIDANEYGVVKYVITSVDELNRLPKKIAPSSQAILIENGLRVFVYGDGQWVEEVVDGDLSENMQSIVADYERSKIGYDGVKRGSLEERLKDDFQGIYDILNARDYCEYSGKELKVDNTWMGNQIDTRVEGRTLQNLINNSEYKKGSFALYSGTTMEENKEYFILNRGNELKCSLVLKKKLLKPNTKYTLILSKKDVNAEVQIYDVVKESFLLTKSNITRGVFTTLDTLDEIRLYFLNNTDETLNSIKVYKNSIMILEGDYTQTPLSELPYFEGIESVGEREIGKNLCDNIWESGRYTLAEGIPYDDSGAIRTVNFINCKPSTTYTITTFDRDRIYNFNEYNNGVFIKATQGNDQKIRTITTSETTNQIHFSMSTWTENTVIQFEEGTQATPYEPFGYKISGKSCGKNLFDIRKWHDALYGSLRGDDTPLEITEEGKVIIYAKDDDTYTRTGSGGMLICPEAQRKHLYLVNENTTYTLSMKCEGENYAVNYIQFWDENYNSLGLGGHGTDTGFKRTFKTPMGTKFLGIRIGIKNAPIGSSLCYSDFQLEENDYATPYEPYQESTYSIHSPIPLRSLPDGVCDVYDFESGAVIQRVGKVVLDGTQRSIRRADNSDEKINTSHFSFNDYRLVDGSSILCDKLVQRQKNALVSVDNMECLKESGSLWINVYKTNADTVEELRTYLSINPMTVYYQLTEPIIHYLTPSQLKSFGGTTHVISENTLIPTTTTKILTDTYANVSNVNSTTYSLRRGVNDVAETSAIINETDVEQDDVLDVTMCAIDELYSMLEPNLE